MAGELLDVVVVVVTFNSREVLPGLVATLPTGLDGLSWQLVVVDNASSDGSAELARELAPDCLVVETGRNAGYAAGLNAGRAAAPPHRAVLLLNPDVRLDPGCVRTLSAALGAGVGIAVPRLRDSAGDLHLSLRREPTALRAWGDALLGARRAGRWAALGELVSDPAAYDAPTTADWAEGSTQLVSTECWDACGGWDESYFLYSEETDFALRARDLGHLTAYVPDAGAVHLQGESTVSPGLWALLVANKVRLHRRRHGRARAAAFWLASLAREASRAALGSATSRAALATLLSPTRMARRPGPETVRRRS